MYCELKNKEVELKDTLGIKKGNQIVKIFKICSGSYIDIAGKKVHKQCDMLRDEKCLQNRY